MVVNVCLWREELYNESLENCLVLESKNCKEIKFNNNAENLIVLEIRMKMAL